MTTKVHLYLVIDRVAAFDSQIGKEILVEEDLQVRWSVDHRCESFPYECLNCCSYATGVLGPSTEKEGTFSEYLARYFERIEGSTEVAKSHAPGTLIPVYRARVVETALGRDVPTLFWIL